LTCIIGAKCAEGAVIVSDTRTIREYASGSLEATNESKFRFLWDRHIVVAGSGTTLLLDNLFEETESKGRDPTTRPKTWLEAWKGVEDVMDYLKSRYIQRLGRDYGLDVIIGGLEGFDSGDVALRAGDSRGASEPIEKFTILGTGAPYVRPMFELMFHQMLTLRETAILGFFSMLSVIQMGIDQSMGVRELGPEIVTIRPNQKPEFLFGLGDQDFAVALNSALTLDFKNRLVRKIWGKVPQAYELRDVT
jgi:20S proteasome alpha/beta subunit